MVAISAFGGITGCHCRFPGQLPFLEIHSRCFAVLESLRSLVLRRAISVGVLRLEDAAAEPEA